MADRRRRPSSRPPGTTPDLLETIRAFLTRPLDAFLRGSTGLPEVPLQPLQNEAAGAVMELWRRGSTMWAPSPPSARLDAVTCVGGWTELVAEVPALQRPRTASVRYWLDEVEAGVVPYRDGALSFLPYRAERAGCFPLRWEALDRRGRSLGLSPEPQRLHVVDQRPVIALDVELLFSQVPGVVEALRTLGTSGGLDWQLIYLERRDPERHTAVRARIAEAQLPDGALVVLYAESGFGKLDPVHTPALIEAELRRLRADGVPLAVFVSHQALVPRALAHEVASVVVPLAGDEEEAPRPWPARATKTLGLDAATCKRVEASAARLAAARAAGNNLSFRLDQMTPTAAMPGHVAHLELDNRAARERLFAAIDGSQRSIELQCYIFDPGPFAEELAVRLIRRARAGVRVSLLVDALYSRQEVLGTVNPVLDGLAEEDGIDVRAVSPLPTFGSMDVRTMKERDHRKLIVIDGITAFVSGRNVGDAYYSGFDEVPIADFTAHERIPWLDAHIELHGPLVGAVRRAFLVAFAAAGGVVLSDAVSTPAPEGPDTCRLVLHDGVHDAYGLTAYEALIDAATDEVYVVNAFPVFNRLRDTIARAVRRGVTVHLLTGCALTRRTDGSFFAGGKHRELFEYMLKHRLEELVRLGVNVYEYVTLPSDNIVSEGGTLRPYVHAKMLVVDGRALSVGSANLDATASFWEREANVIVEGGELPRAAQATLKELCARSHRLDLESREWRAEAAQRELVARLWPTALYS